MKQLSSYCVSISSSISGIRDFLNDNKFPVYNISSEAVMSVYEERIEKELSCIICNRKFQSYSTIDEIKQGLSFCKVFSQ